MNRRVVITGVGLVSPLGIGVNETWQALCDGKSGVGEISRFDTSKFQTKIAAEVKNFNPQDFLPKKEAKRTELFIAYAIAATRMAIEDSGLVIDSTNADRVGAITGCGLGGLRFMEDTVLRVSNQGPKRVSPFFIPMMIGNMAPGMISIQFGAKGLAWVKMKADGEWQSPIAKFFTDEERAAIGEALDAEEKPLSIA